MGDFASPIYTKIKDDPTTELQEFENLVWPLSYDESNAATIAVLKSSLDSYSSRSSDCGTRKCRHEFNISCALTTLIVVTLPLSTATGMRILAMIGNLGVPVRDLIPLKGTDTRELQFGQFVLAMVLWPILTLGDLYYLILCEGQSCLHTCGAI